MNLMTSFALALFLLNQLTFKRMRRTAKTPVKFYYSPQLSTWQIFHRLIEEVRREGNADAVARHLVGAKLQLRFPDIAIYNEPVSTYDDHASHRGDFIIGNTVFYVTVFIQESLFKKCQQHLDNQMRTYLIVPDAILAANCYLANELCSGPISVQSLESFLSLNIEEISFFSADQLKESIVRLVDIYNERVSTVESDKSLMIKLSRKQTPLTA